MSKTEKSLETRQTTLVRVISRPETLKPTAYLLAPTRMKKTLKTESGVKERTVIHEHIFYSVGEDGKARFGSASVGGHYHDVHLVPGPNGETIAHCGPPKCYKKRRVNGVLCVVSEVWRGDEHTHEVIKINE